MFAETMSWSRSSILVRKSPGTSLTWPISMASFFERAEGLQIISSGGTASNRARPSIETYETSTSKTSSPSASTYSCEVSISTLSMPGVCASTSVMTPISAKVSASKASFFTRCSFSHHHFTVPRRFFRASLNQE